MRGPRFDRYRKARDSMDSLSNKRREQNLHLQFELVPATEHADPATVGEVARDVADMLRKDVYIVEPAYTGTRGGTVFEIVLEFAQNAWDNKELLIVLFGVAKPIAECLKERLNPSNTPEPMQIPAQSSKITIAVDGAQITVEAPDAVTAAELAQQFQHAHPAIAAKVTPQSTITVTGHVPPKSRSRRR